MCATHEDWNDFTHSTEPSRVQPHDLLERYRVFRSLIAGIPAKELVARHWLKSESDDAHLLALFFDFQPTSQETLFRRNATTDEKLLALWHARARKEAERFAVTTEASIPYTGIAKDDLHNLARISVDPRAVKQLPQILAGFGIFLVYVYALPGMNADGAAFKLTTGNPVVAMSLRFPRLDYFGFTLLHELAHLVLHDDQLEKTIIFDVEAVETNGMERAANRLAKDSIVSKDSWRSCEPKYDTSDRALRVFASSQGVHPSLIAGLLRKEFGDYKRYSAIVNENNIRDIIFQQ